MKTNTRTGSPLVLLAKTLFLHHYPTPAAAVSIQSRIISQTITTRATTTRSTTALAMSTWGSISADTKEDYKLPEVWVWETPDKDAINQPTAGSRYEKELPIGEHDIQLYSMATPNGVKVTILLEELLEAGYADAEYDAWPINIMGKDQFGSGFVAINPNSKIPAMMIKSNNVKIFESGSILQYLADHFHAFIPSSNDDNIIKRTETLNWLYWQMGSAPYVGNFGHFYHYANVKQRYPIERFTMETKRQLDVLNKNLQDKTYMIGDVYTIADIAIFSWYGALILDMIYPNAATFLNAARDYPHVLRWAKQINERPAVIRGRKVNRFWGEKYEQLHERHSPDDFLTKTQDKVETTETTATAT